MTKEDAWRIAELLKDFDWSIPTYLHTTKGRILLHQMTLLEKAYSVLKKECCDEGN